MKNDILESKNFSYEGYQVVRGEFFAHIKEPSLTFNNCKIYVNMTCLNKLPDIDYVHILVNPTEQKLVVRPCKEEEKDSFCWCSKSSKRQPKQITCRIFFAKIINMMNWNPEYRYKLIGKLIHTSNEVLFVFDLKTAEIFQRIIYKDKKSKLSRTPIFPEDWKDQFGLSFEEHKKSLQVNILNGYAVFELKDNKKNQIINNQQIQRGEIKE